jgi:WD40 repeat protein
VDGGRELAAAQPYRRSVLGLGFTPDGATLVGASTGSPAVTLWDVSDLLPGRHPAPQPAAGSVRGPVVLKGAGEVHGLYLPADGRTLLLRRDHGPGREPAVELWDVAARRPKAVLRTPGGKDPRARMALSPDGRWFAECSAGSLRVWKVDGESPQQTTPVGSVPGKCLALAFSPDGKALALGMEDGAVSRSRSPRNGVRCRPDGVPLAHACLPVVRRIPCLVVHQRSAMPQQRRYSAAERAASSQVALR